MTARQQQIRVARLTRDRSPIDAYPAPAVGELLQAARERKGVDLYRAERDTKIRARHLAALESGEYSELPGAVYTKGFLRNYALYLGLDPEDILERWRDEQDFGRRGEPMSVTPPPQPLAEPHRGLTFSPGLLIAIAIAVVALLFVGYIGLQLVRFSQVPPITLQGDQNITLAEDATKVVLTGTAGANAAINISDAGDNILQTIPADENGGWVAELGVSKGRNDFTLVARDPDTGRTSDPLRVIVTVPILVSPQPDTPTSDTPGASQVPATSSLPLVTTNLGTGHKATPIALQSDPVAQIALTQPKDGMTILNDSATVSGTTDARSVTVTAAWKGAGKAPAKIAPVSLKVKDGRFSGTLALPAGKWAVTATTDDQAGLQPAADQRAVSVAWQGLQVIVEEKSGSAWVRVWIDGVAVEKGHRFLKGDSVTYTAKKTAVVSSGNAGNTTVTINGIPYGPLGKPNTIQAVQFEKGKDPRPLN
ncbi:MAG: DUF4115 domain-containing protein [Chloroflexota bacterium]